MAAVLVVVDRVVVDKGMQDVVLVADEAAINLAAKGHVAAINPEATVPVATDLAPAVKLVKPLRNFEKSPRN